MRQSSTRRVSRLLTQFSRGFLSMEVILSSSQVIAYRVVWVGEPMNPFACANIRTTMSDICVLVALYRDSGNEGVDIKLHGSQDRGI
jgi:hypothetical protein